MATRVKKSMKSDSLMCNSLKLHPVCSYILLTGMRLQLGVLFGKMNSIATAACVYLFLRPDLEDHKCARMFGASYGRAALPT